MGTGRWAGGAAPAVLVCALVLGLLAAGRERVGAQNGPIPPPVDARAVDLAPLEGGFAGTVSTVSGPMRLWCDWTAPEGGHLLSTLRWMAPSGELSRVDVSSVTAQGAGLVLSLLQRDGRMAVRGTSPRPEGDPHGAPQRLHLVEHRRESHGDVGFVFRADDPLQQLQRVSYTLEGAGDRLGIQFDFAEHLARPPLSFWLDRVR